MRTHGHSYREFESRGLMLVVVEMNVKYMGAAVFDDLLSLTTRVIRSRGVRIHHAYELTRPGEIVSATSTAVAELKPEVIVTANSTIACIDRQGKVRPLPDYLRS